MKLFQYWDTDSPPDDVAAWIEGFRAQNPEFKHRLYSRDSASRFIRKHLGQREQKAFDAIAVPSMQSDYFRYCAVETLGGLYLDADYQPGQPLSGLIAQAPHALMLKWWGHVVGGALMCREPGNAFIRACRELTTDNIENRRFPSAFTAGGPGVMNAIRLLFEPEAHYEIMASYDNPNGRHWQAEELHALARNLVEVTPELRAAYASFTVIHCLAAEKWLGTKAPGYKRTPTHWTNWSGSIYRDQAQAPLAV